MRNVNSGGFGTISRRRLGLLLTMAAVGGLAPARSRAAQVGDAPIGPYPELPDPSNFTNPLRINNKWLPLLPGRRWTWQGTTVDDDGEVLPHRVEITVTDLTKVVNGVPNVVCHDLDYSNGELVEAELAMFAQDDHGAVWHFGQYSEEYEDGKTIGAPTWIHGIEDARAGVMMPADPRPGTPSYSEGWGPAVKWADRGRVDQIGATVTVPAGTFRDVLIIAETSHHEPEAEQLKSYAPNVGNVQVGWRGRGEKSKEVLELVTFEQLDAAGLTAARAAALQLEQSAFARKSGPYVGTAPIVIAAR